MSSVLMAPTLGRRTDRRITLDGGVCATGSRYLGHATGVADRRPMDGCVEWQLAETGGLQIFRNPENTAVATVIIGLDDLDTEVVELARRGISAEPYDVPSGQFRLAQLQDPSGNTIVLSQSLT
jgi:hypothetical protein